VASVQRSTVHRGTDSLVVARGTMCQTRNAVCLFIYYLFSLKKGEERSTAAWPHGPGEQRQRPLFQASNLLLLLSTHLRRMGWEITVLDSASIQIAQQG
jgi:hypothetical protein